MLRPVVDDTNAADVSTDENAIEVNEAPPVDPGVWTRHDSVWLAIVTAVAGALRLFRLAPPAKLVFDETYYAKDACWYVNVSQSICDTSSEISQVHPPLAKWILAIGIRIFGYDSFGWRVTAAIAGTIAVALLYLLAKKLLRSTVGAVVTSGLLALDFLHFVQSRIAMLDIFTVTFGIACILFVVYDRERLLDENVPAEAWRPWRLAAGAAGGAAAACKWSGAFFLLAAVVATITWEIGARRKKGEDMSSAIRGFMAQESVTVFLWLFIAPIAVYAFTYIGRLEWTEGTWYQALWDRHKYMADFHTNLISHHSYESPAWSWLLLKRPVSYFFETDPQGNYKEIFAAGNPFVWWPGVVALVYTASRWIRTRAIERPESMIIGGFAATYLLWLPLSLTGRSATFLFYLLPAIPFMCLALGYIASIIGDSWEAKAAIGLFGAGVVALFAFYYPLLTQVAIPEPDWDRRIWIFDHCDVGEGYETTTQVTETQGKETRTFETTTTTTESLPPAGWCWI